MKKCTKCNIEKHETEYYKEKLGKNGLMSRCKACINKQNNSWAQRNGDKKKKHKKNYLKRQELKHATDFYIQNSISKLICTQCKLKKNNRQFYKCPTNKSGYRYECIACCMTKDRLREYDNEKIRKRMAVTRSELKDPYIKHRLKQQGFTNQIITDNPGLIEVTRDILKIKRYVKEKTTGKHSGT